MEDVNVPIKSCFKYRELDMDWDDRNWIEESYLYVKDWMKELNPASRLSISDFPSNTSNEDEWSPEFQSYAEDWEIESETELNVHVRDWITEFGDWETTSDIRVRVPTLCGFEDNGRNATEKCAICLEIFQDFIIFGVLENCGHKFCFTCLEGWSNIGLTCPMCRTPFQCILKRYCGFTINITDFLAL